MRSLFDVYSSYVSNQRSKDTWCKRDRLSLLSLFSPSYLSQRDRDESRWLCSTAVLLRRSSSRPSGPLPTAVSFVRDGWSAFDSGTHLSSRCSRRLLTLAIHLPLRWFRPALLRVNLGFVFFLPDLCFWALRFIPSSIFCDWGHAIESRL